MANILPFAALRPAPGKAEAVAAPPYDVLNSAEAAVAVQGNPDSFLHVTKSEIDLPGIADIHSTPVYEKAKENLEAFIRKGVLFREDKPCYYVYELTMNGRSQTGLVAVSSVEDYENGIIKKHEFTRPEKENDRINHIRISGAQTGNVFLAYRDVPEIDTLIDAAKQQTPLYDFVAPDGISHRVWVVNDPAKVTQITTLFDTKVPHTYIADGHHRAASAAKVRRGLDKGYHQHADYFLTTLFPAGQLYIMDYNRVVKDLNGLSAEDFLRSLYDDFDVEKMPSAFSPTRLHEFGLYLGGQWYKLTTKEGRHNSDPIGILDVTILSELVLDKILGISDQRTDKRIDFVGGIRGLKELERRVDNGEMAVAFSLHPVTIEQLFDIADSGNIMPPKSTWFEPKLRDGLLTHLIYS
ncbi:DUF1015 domain-containing protein [Flavihumibacter petaseus]|uniref:DUF1015 domain-containing protein n=1 Tax=Flavihumibacter petaseus NBRC 106054 TaxID=1220578 RepID=A0A0E9MXM5_9BACT|nr:DUF1015 family protein [Flavihumibacter petaseus]GAO41860.1 hypothetical protein FPE01S_01_08750 [Flavihumibacter petaseus NBRC 106054]